MWKLVIEDDEGKRTVVPLTRDQYSIGRKEGNTIRLTERNVSREHARIFKKPRTARLRRRPRTTRSRPTSSRISRATTASSSTGCASPTRRTSSHGDLVQIGDYRIVLQDEALLDVATRAVPSEAKQTIPQGRNSRAATLLDRPNRLVMLAGPTPGAEFPLDNERMTHRPRRGREHLHRPQLGVAPALRGARAGRRALRDRRQGLEQRRAGQRRGPAARDRRAG